MSKFVFQPAGNSSASQPAAHIQTLMQEIRTFGRVPRRTKDAADEECQLAVKLAKARDRGLLSEEQEAELIEMGEAEENKEKAHSEPVGESSASQPAAYIGELMREIRDFGRLPRR